MLEADKSNESVFYNTLSSDHPDSDISSSKQDKEYLKKVHILATGGIRISIVVKNCDIHELRQKNNWEGVDSVYDARLLSSNTPRKGFSYKKFISMIPEWETQKLLI